MRLLKLNSLINTFLILVVSFYAQATQIKPDENKVIHPIGHSIHPAVQSWNQINLKTLTLGRDIGLAISKQFIICQSSYAGAKFLLNRYVPQHPLIGLVLSHKVLAGIITRTIYTYLMEHNRNGYLSLSSHCAWDLEKQAFQSYISAYPESYPARINNMIKGSLFQPYIKLGASLAIPLLGIYANKLLIEQLTN